MPELSGLLVAADYEYAAYVMAPDGRWWGTNGAWLDANAGPYLWWQTAGGPPPPRPDPRPALFRSKPVPGPVYYLRLLRLEGVPDGRYLLIATDWANPLVMVAPSPLPIRIAGGVVTPDAGLLPDPPAPPPDPEAIAKLVADDLWARLRALFAGKPE